MGNAAQEFTHSEEADTQPPASTADPRPSTALSTVSPTAPAQGMLTQFFRSSFFRSSFFRSGLLTRTIPLASAALGLPTIGTVVLLSAINPIAHAFQSAGFLGMVGFYVCFSVLCGTALMPTWVAAVVAGWAFGALPGIAVSLLASLSAGTFAFFVSQRLTGNSITSMLEMQPHLRRMYTTLVRGDWRLTFGLVALLRLPPNGGFAFMSVLLAAARVRFLPFIAGTAVGLLPRTIAICYVSAQTSTLDLTKKGALFPLFGWLFVLIIVVAGLTVLSRIGVQRIQSQRN